MVSNESIVLSALSQDNFVMVNKQLLVYLKGDAVVAIILSELISLYNYYKNAGMIGDESWFFQTVDSLEEKLGINDYQQRRSIKVLEELGLLKIKHFGTPQRRFFKLNFDNIVKTLDTVRPVSAFKMSPEKMETKENFYDNLNKSIYESVEATGKALGNINKPLGEFLYAWSKLYHKNTNKHWLWTPREFGIISNYWKSVYRKKHFNYGSLRSFFRTRESEAYTLYKLISFDRSFPEAHHSMIETLSDLIQFESLD